MLGRRIEPPEATRLQPTGPDLAVPVRHHLVERVVRNRRRILGDATGLRIDLDQHAAASAQPAVAVQVEGSARRVRLLGWGVGLPHLPGLGIQPPDAVPIYAPPAQYRPSGVTMLS